MGQALRDTVPKCAQSAAAWGSGEILDDLVWNRIRKDVKKRRVGWLHLAFPANFFRPAVEVGDLPAREDAVRRVKRICAVMLYQIRAGGRVSLAHPARSTAWELPSLKGAVESLLMTSFIVDLCTVCGPYERPTKWLTNCAWLRAVEKQCPGRPLHSKHLPFGMFGGTMSRQDLPVGFCEHIARLYAKSDKARVKVADVVMTAGGWSNPFAKRTARQLKESENENGDRWSAQPAHLSDQGAWLAASR